MSNSDTIESMTGYGEARAKLAGMTLLCRVRSLNHRFLDVKVRLPKSDLLSLDMAVRKRIGELFKRGAIEFTLAVESRDAQSDDTASALNTELAERYTKAARGLAKKLKLKAKDISLDALLRLPGIVNAEGTSDGFREIDEKLLFQKLVDPALAALKKARLNEGTKLSQHLVALLDQMDDHVREITTLEGPEKEKGRAALVERAQETLKLLSAEAAGSASRLEEFNSRMREEAVFWIERRDFDEERVRLGIHLKELRGLVTKSAAATPDGVGRKLEFIQQEILREINTLGTKSQSTAITSHTIELKTILERLREQLANVA